MDIKKAKRMKKEWIKREKQISKKEGGGERKRKGL
jgi:hypothetical protein